MPSWAGYLYCTRVSIHWNQSYRFFQVLVILCPPAPVCRLHMAPKQINLLTEMKLKAVYLHKRDKVNSQSHSRQIHNIASAPASYYKTGCVCACARQTVRAAWATCECSLEWSAWCQRLRSSPYGSSCGRWAPRCCHRMRPLRPTAEGSEWLRGAAGWGGAGRSNLQHQTPDGTSLQPTEIIESIFCNHSF